VKNRTSNARISLSGLAAAIFSAGLVTACASLTAAPAADVSPLSESAILAMAQEVHQNIIVLDGHADIVLPSTSSLYLGADGTSKVSLEKLKAGQVGVAVMSVAVAPGQRTPEGDAAARAEADQKIAAINTLVSENPDDVVLALSAADIRSANSAGKTALMLGFQNARSLERRIDALDEFYAAGVRVFALNHIGHNDFSDSSRPFYDGVKKVYEPAEEHGGLSALGVAAVERINLLGGVIDVTQSSKAATLQMIDLSKTPVIASHSNARPQSNVSRNLSEEEIDRIGETGGVIHVVAFGPYLVDYSDPALLAEIKQVRLEADLPEAYSYPYELYWEIADPEKKLAFLGTMKAVIGPGSVARMVDHIDYIAGRIGVDHVAIGTDFNHGGGVDGFNEADDALNVTIELVRRGYSNSDIEKIWSGNFLRVLSIAENSAARLEEGTINEN